MAEDLACRFCQHDYSAHTAEHGCEYCTCAGHPTEIWPLSEADWTRRTLPPDSAVYPYHPIRKDADMSTTSARQAIDADIEVLEARLYALKAQRARLDVIPPQPGDGTVVKFTVQFDAHGRVYRYAAMSINGMWYTTAEDDKKRRLTWSGLIKLMRQDFSVRTGATPLRYTVAEPDAFTLVEV